MSSNGKGTPLISGKPEFNSLLADHLAVAQPGKCAPFGAAKSGVQIPPARPSCGFESCATC